MKLDDTGADGFVPMRSLGTDFFIHDEAKRAVIGRSTGEMHRLGDAVEVKLVEAAPLAGALRFELLSSGRIVPRAQRPKGEPRRGKHKDARKAKPAGGKSAKAKGRKR